MRRNIVHEVTRKYMKLNKKRTFTTYIGIVFMVLLMTCVFVGKDTAIDYMEQVASLKEGKWHAAMYDITEKELSEIRKLSYVKETAVSVGRGVTRFSGAKKKLRPYLNIKGYSEKCFDWMNIEVAEGRLPRNSQEVVLSKSAVEDGADVKIGDTIRAEYLKRSITGIDPEVKETVFPFFDITVKYKETVQIPEDFPYYGENESFQENTEATGESGEYTVVGIMEAPSFEDPDAGYAAITGLDEEEARKLGAFNVSMILDLGDSAGMDYQELREIAGDHEIDFNNYLLAFSGNSSDNSINLVVKFLVVFFTVLIMAASVLLIYNVFNLSFQERSRYLGMLSSVGATGRQKRSSIYYEAFYLLLTALPAGILAGILVVKLGITVLRPFLGKFMGLEAYVETCSVTVKIFPENIMMILVISVVTVLLSAWLPARKISRIGPIECIRGNAEHRKDRAYRMNLPALRHFGAEGMLAGNTVRRERKKTRSITVAAVVFIVIMMVSSFGAESVKEIADARIGNADIGIDPEKWDYMLVSMNGDTEEFRAIKEEIGQDAGVETVREWHDGMFIGIVPSEVYSKEYWQDYREIFNLYYRRELTDKEFEKYAAEGEGTVNVLSVDEDTLEELARLTGADIEKLKDKEHPAAIVVQDGELSTDSVGVGQMEPEKYRFYHVEKMTDMKPGEKMPVSIYSEEEDKNVEFPVEIAGFASAEQLQDYASFHSQFLWIITSNNVAEKINNTIGKNSDGAGMAAELLMKMNGKDTDIIDKLRKMGDDEDSAIYLADAGYTKNLTDAIKGMINVMMVCFVILTSIICVMNLFNSIRGRITERRKEFAVMKSVGMTGKQMKKMLLCESICILMKSVILSALISIPLILGVRYELVRTFGNVLLRPPVTSFMAAAGITVVVVVGMTLYCFSREKRTNILDDIREESI